MQNGVKIENLLKMEITGEKRKIKHCTVHCRYLKIVFIYRATNWLVPILESRFVDGQRLCYEVVEAATNTRSMELSLTGKTFDLFVNLFF